MGEGVGGDVVVTASVLGNDVSLFRPIGKGNELTQLFSSLIF